MAGFSESIIRVKENLQRAKARALILGMFGFMTLAVLLGTVGVLRFSYVPVARQYQDTLQRTLQRVVADFNSLDGQIAFANFRHQIAGPSGIPIAKLPVDFLNVLPGHIEELKPLAACSYAAASKPDNQICAGVLDNKAYGAMVYLRGSFRIKGPLTTPVYSKSPVAAHHFLIAVTARGRTSRFIVTFDPVRRAESMSNSVFSPAWSVAGFRAPSENTQTLVREPDIKGRVLAESTDVDDASRYTFIIQVPVYVYADDVVASPAKWPPPDINDARLSIQLIGPTNGVQSPSNILMDSSEAEGEPMFSLGRMNQYLSPGETLRFLPPSGSPQTAIEVSAPTASKTVIPRSTFAKVAGTLIKTVIPDISTKRAVSLSDGGSIEIQGNPALVLGGWGAAAQYTIGFAALLCAGIMASAFFVQKYVLAPLNHLRRNTLYLRGKFSDADDFRLPHPISGGHDEIGVLWRSIEELHRSITTYGREALERSKDESDLLRALGHEIKSPLQDLLIRHNQPDDPSAKSIRRISYALKVLGNTYSSQGADATSEITNPRDAIKASAGNFTREDIAEYLRNAAELDESCVHFQDPQKPLNVRADGDMLEAALTAILNNAKDFRADGSLIEIKTHSDLMWGVAVITNEGPPIPFTPIEEVFNFGVSSRDSDGAHQGLGLFMAKQYVIKMGGELSVKNTKTGVRFEIKLPRAH